MKFKVETSSLSDPRVATFLAAATDESNRFRSKISLDKALGNGKKRLRVYLSASGRYFVMGGVRGHSRLLLADTCQITSFEESDNPLFEFRLEIIERRRQADLAAFASRYPECA